MAQGKGGYLPRKEVDWEQFDKLCALQCTQNEIAYQMNMCTNTLAARVKEKYDMRFFDLFQERRAPGLIALRNKQYKVAMDGDPQMLKWLGVNWLGQVSSKITITDERPINYVTPESMTEENDAEYARSKSTNGGEPSDNFSEETTFSESQTFKTD